MTDNADTTGVASRYVSHASDVELAVHAEHDRNLKFFIAHQDELFAKHPKQFLLIHSGNEVVASADPFELNDLRNTFDDVTRCAALLEIEVPVPLIATPFYR